MKSPAVPALPAGSADEIAAWVAANQDNPEVPESVRIALRQHQILYEKLRTMGHNHRGVLVQLKLALGVSASTERRSSGRPVGAKTGGDGRKPRNERERLLLNRERHDTLSRWHGELSDKHQKKMKRINNRLEKLPEQQPEGQVADQDESPEQQDVARNDQYIRGLNERYNLGGEPDPALQSVTETLMHGAEANITDEGIHVPAPELPTEGCKLLETRVEERVRYDFRLEVARVIANVEKKVFIDEQGFRRVISASTAELGPPRFRVTWGFLVNMVILVVQYAMPMSRLANMLSSSHKRFTAGGLARMLRYVALHFAPIYLQLFDDLSDAAVLQGDDTTPRVLEVQRYFNRPSSPEGNPRPPPWEPYRTADEAQSTFDKVQDSSATEAPSLAVLLARELGFEFERRTDGKPKRALNTTVLSGRKDQRDPRSYTVFYRSHIGGFGNLLETLLRRRNPREKRVAVQTDLATVNLVRDQHLLRTFDIRQYGCASHARRPFAQYEHEDPELCDMMLHFFKGVCLHEDGLDLYGRNMENVTAIRNVDARRNWQLIKELAEIVSKKWSPRTKLGDAARYIIRHYNELTAYLNDPRLEPTNNLSERMLRLEKLIQSGSMFRTTLEGRFALDVMRSVLQTAIAAQVPLYEYVFSVLTTPREEIEKHPERYTPRAWGLRHLSSDIAAESTSSAATSATIMNQPPR